MEPSDPPYDLSVDLEASVIYTRLAQGLPARVEDRTVLALIADLICLHQADHDGDRDERRLVLTDLHIAAILVTPSPNLVLAPRSLPLRAPWYAVSSGGRDRGEDPR